MLAAGGATLGDSWRTRGRATAPLPNLDCGDAPQKFRLLWWTDHGPTLDLEAEFLVRDGADITNKTVLWGRTRAVREPSEITGLHLRRRIAALFRAPASEAARKPAPPPPSRA
jgi:hypothetical protein